ncbi:EamA family transporter [Mucilaginibacter defluvii]|uniref:EamA family transporter n=2 Tax=Mucilaginibacter defluvii TaxID=1196019 RepID=A0ABP9G197_9SPHI
MAYQLLRGERPFSIIDWLKNAVSGILILSFGTGLLAWGEQYISSTEGCIIQAAAPFIFIAADRPQWKTHFSNKKIIAGLVIGFIGLVLFLSGGLLASGAVSHAKLIGSAMVIVSLFFWVGGSLFTKKQPAAYSIATNTAQQLICAGIFSLLLATGNGEFKSFKAFRVPDQAWYGLGYLILFGSLMAYFSYQYLLSVERPVIVSTHTYINPLVAVFAGWLLAGEKITALQVAGLIITLAGVFITNMDKYKSKKKSPKSVVVNIKGRKHSLRLITSETNR